MRVQEGGMWIVPCFHLLDAGYIYGGAWGILIDMACFL